MALLGGHRAEAINFLASPGDEPPMALMTLPGTEVRLDPDRITKIEICCAETARVGLRVFLSGESTHHEFEFPDKAAAVDFYRQVWLLRSDDNFDACENEKGHQMETLMARKTVEPA
jgi:hypothetical protein